MATRTTTKITKKDVSSIEEKKGSDVRSSDPTREYLGGSTARKFRTRGDVSFENEDVIDQDKKTNSDSLIETATGLSTVASMAPSIAAASRDRLKLFRDSLKRSSIDSTDSQDEFNVSRDSLPGQILSSTVKSIGMTNDVTTSITPLSMQSKEDVTSKSLVIDSAKNDLALSGKLADRMTMAVDGMMELSTKRSAFKNRRELGISYNSASPIIDSISLEESKDKGAIDKFFAKISFILKTDLIKKNDVVGFRVFRSSTSDMGMARRSFNDASLFAMNEMRSRPSNGSKIESNVILQSMNLKSSGIDNMLTKNVKKDELTNVWHGLSRADESSIVPMKRDDGDERKNALLSGMISDERYHSLDRSVVENLNAMRNIQLQDPAAASEMTLKDTQGLSVVTKDSIGSLSNRQILDAKNQLGDSDQIVKANKNFDRFKEIAFVPIEDALISSTLGMSEFSVDDVTISYGRSYRYFVVSINRRMVESTRSKIVQLNVEILKVPDPPESVTVSNDEKEIRLSILHRSSDIEKFEIYRKCNLREDEDKNITIVNGRNGFVLDDDTRTVLKNGFIQIGETTNSCLGTNSFIDRDVMVGRSYMYRVYSVDIYGNKSSFPKEVVVSLDAGMFPTLLTEQLNGSTFIKIIMSSNDENIVAFFLSRRDMTIGQEVFTTPNQPSIIKICNNHSPVERVSMLGSVFSDQDAWNGYHENNGSKIEFIDKLTTIDHMYQYMLYGIDRNGVKTSHVFSKPLVVARRSFVERPLNLRKVIVNEQKIRIEWDDPNLTISPYEMIGNRDDLDSTSIRMLYQVERSDKTGEWKKFPLVDVKYIDETIATKSKRSITMPLELDLDSRYMYRVMAYRSGGYSSNYSDELVVSTDRSIDAPIDLKITYQNINVKPFFVSLCWNTSETSGPIDGWEIYRCEMNNFAAASLNLSDSAVLSSLKFDHLTDVHVESSRFRSRDIDEMERSNVGKKTNGLLLNDHHYVDRTVTFGNTYVYKMRSFGLGDSFSQFVYRGIKITSPVFEQKMAIELSNEEKDRLKLQQIPLVLRRK